MTTHKNFIFCFLLVLICTFTTNVNASIQDTTEIAEAPTSQTEKAPYSFKSKDIKTILPQTDVDISENGETLLFKSDENIVQPFSSKEYSRGDLVYKEYARSELFGTVYRKEAYFYAKNKISKKFVKYLTGSWAYSDKYTWSKTNTTTLTFSGESGKSFAKKVTAKLGFSISRSTSYSVAVNIPANAKKLSKLGFASDYEKIFYDYKYYKDGTLQKKNLDSCLAPLEDTYLLVYYKK